MKNTLVFLSTCFLLSLNLSGQNSFPFIEEGKVWAELSIIDDVPPGMTQPIWTDYYKFEGVTTFQGKEYHLKYACHRDSTMMNWTQNPYLYREEAGKVYASNMTNDDVLLYDFNLGVGDSALIVEGMGYAKVINVDSTLIAGSYRRTLHFDFPPDTWIEGIGSIHDPFGPLIYYFYVGGIVDLLCVNDSSGKLYQNPSYSGCFVDITGMEEAGRTEPLLRIFPDPFTTSCTVEISGPAGQFERLQVSDNLGRIVRDENVLTSRFVFERRDMAPGIYLMRFTGTGGMVIRRIMIR